MLSHLETCPELLKNRGIFVADDNSFAGEPVFECVPARNLLTGLGLRTGALLRIGAVGSELFVGCHFSVFSSLGGEKNPPNCCAIMLLIAQLPTLTSKISRRFMITLRPGRIFQDPMGALGLGPISLLLPLAGRFSVRPTTVAHRLSCGSDDDGRRKAAR